MWAKRYASNIGFSPGATWPGGSGIWARADVARHKLRAIHNAEVSRVFIGSGRSRRRKEADSIIGWRGPPGCERKSKRHGAAALQDLAEELARNPSRQRLGVRQPHAAFVAGYSILS